MTREELAEIMSNIIWDPEEFGRKDEIAKAADRILAALEREREGEVVLDFKDYANLNIVDGHFCLWGKQGQLIFRPDKADKEGA